MVFVITYTIAPESRNAAQERFKSGGGLPPAGVKMVGRWHAVGGGRGLTICESDDALAVANWAQQWSDLISFDVYPVLDDASFANYWGRAELAMFPSNLTKSLREHDGEQG